LRTFEKIVLCVIIEPMKLKSNFSECFSAAATGKLSIIGSEKFKGGFRYGKNMV